MSKSHQQLHQSRCDQGGGNHLLHCLATGLLWRFNSYIVKLVYSLATGDPRWWWQHKETTMRRTTATQNRQSAAQTEKQQCFIQHHFISSNNWLELHTHRATGHFTLLCTARSELLPLSLRATFHLTEYVCVEISVSKCARVRALDPSVYIYACMHMWAVYVHQNALKQTSNWRQRCKNRENAADQWEHGLRAGTPPPQPSSSLRFALNRSLQLVTGALGWMDSYSYSNSPVTLWATGWKRGMVSRPLECATPFFWTLVESEGRGRQREGQGERKRDKRGRWK